MLLSVVARLLLVLGRLVGFAGAVLTVGTLVLGFIEAVLFFLRYGPDWNVGIVPLVFVLQTIVAGWVVWSVVKRDARTLLRNLLLAFGGSFIALYGWYFLLAGEGGELIAIGNLFYLVASLVVGCALLLSMASARLGNDHPR